MWRLCLEYRTYCTVKNVNYNSSILVSAGDIIGTTGSWEFFVACNKFCILTVTATYATADVQETWVKLPNSYSEFMVIMILSF